jgi:ferrous iron transport protein B
MAGPRLTRTRRVILVGNPNVGKSLLFSRITRLGVETANYAGTTVSIKTGRFSHDGEAYELVDGPGIYSLEEFSEADSAAIELIKGVDAARGDIVVDVIDSTNLERNLALTLQLAARGLPMIACLNFWDETKHKGIAIDIPELSRQLGMPVVPASALDGSGVSDLVDAFGWELSPPEAAGQMGPEELWASVGRVVVRAQRLEHRHHSFLERLSDLTLHPVGGPICAAIVLVSTLLIVRFIGEGLVNSVLEPAYTKFYAPFIIGLADRIPWRFAAELLAGRGADPLGSFGILTSGVYIALVLVFPYFLAFYLVFGFLEDFGYLPRLAVVLDKAFHKLGLHGYSAIPVMLGLGCKVPALMSTRMLSSEREKTLTTALILMSAPCLPQTSMIIALGMSYGVPVVLAVFGSLAAIALLANIAINAILKGEDTELFTELPAYRVPRLRLLAGKLMARIVDYFGEVLPMIAIGVLAMNVLNVLGVIEVVTEAVKVPARVILGLPEGIAPIMILGFLRKDVSIALLAPLRLSAGQFIVASVFLALYAPCVASFFTLVRESGFAGALRIVGLALAGAILGAASLHFCFAAFGV